MEESRKVRYGERLCWPRGQSFQLASFWFLEKGIMYSRKLGLWAWIFPSPEPGQKSLGKWGLLQKGGFFPAPARFVTQGAPVSHGGGYTTVPSHGDGCVH